MLTYSEAKAWARGHQPKINGVKEWRELRKIFSLPQGMPAWPQGYYGSEFEGWGEFLGTGNIAATRRNFKPYNKAKTWAQSQKPAIKTKSEWCLMVKQKEVPQDIPVDPRSHYKEEFEGWGKFLGTGAIANQCRKIMPYSQAKAWVRAQSPVIYSRAEYIKRVKASSRTDLPSSPSRSYRDEFEGWAKFLGVRSLSSTSMIERMLKQELLSFLPVDPIPKTIIKVSQNKQLQIDIYLPSLDLIIEYDGGYFHKDTEREDLRKNEKLISVNPNLTIVRVREYPLKKIGGRDLIVKANEEPLSLAQKVTEHLMKLNLIPEGMMGGARDYLRRNTLVENTIIGVRWRSYNQARKWVRSMGIASVADWRRKTKNHMFLPADIPVNPKSVYKDLFLGWSDFLGVEIIAPKDKPFWSYDKARKWATDDEIKSGKEWQVLSSHGKLPKQLPSNPQATYKKEWRGWREFLGRGKATDTPWASLEEITKWAQAQNPPVRTFKDWQEAKVSPDFPLNFPKSLHYHFGSGAFKKLRAKP